LPTFAVIASYDDPSLFFKLLMPKPFPSPALQKLMEYGLQAEYQNKLLYAKGRPPFKKRRRRHSLSSQKKTGTGRSFQWALTGH